MTIQFKTHARMHRIARMVVMGFKDDRIAAAVGLTPAGLATLKQSQQYKDLEKEVLDGYIDSFDEAIADDVKAMRQEFKSAVPAAMRTIVDAALQKKDLKASIEAAKEILDRDPNRTFSKQTGQTNSLPQAPVIPDSVLDSVSKQADSVTNVINTPKTAVN